MPHHDRGNAIPRAGGGSEQPSDLDRLHTASGSTPVILRRGAWDTYYPSLARAVRGQGPPPVSSADTVATAIVSEAARARAAGGQTITIA